jgi:hypothetical protein
VRVMGTPQMNTDARRLEANVARLGSLSPSDRSGICVSSVFICGTPHEIQCHLQKPG